MRRDKNDRLVLAFSEYTSVPVDEVARSDSDYLRWLLTQDYLPDFRAFRQRALAQV